MDTVEIKKIILESNEQYSVLYKQFLRDYRDSMMKNMELRWNLVKNFVVISSGIIGFTVPVFGKTDLIKSQVLLSSALFGLTIVVAYGLVYLTYVFVKDERGLEKVLDDFTCRLKLLKEVGYKTLACPTDGNLKDYGKSISLVNEELTHEQQQNKKLVFDVNLIVICTLFFVALFLIFLSVTPLAIFIKHLFHCYV